MERVVRPWNRLPREVVESLSPYPWRCLGKDWSWSLMPWPIWHGGVGAKVELMISKVLFQPNWLSDSLAAASSMCQDFPMSRPGFSRSMWPCPGKRDVHAGWIQGSRCGKGKEGSSPPTTTFHGHTLNVTVPPPVPAHSILLSSTCQQALPMPPFLQVEPAFCHPPLHPQSFPLSPHRTSTVL